MIGSTQSSASVADSYILFFGLIALVLFALRKRGQNVIAASSKRDRSHYEADLGRWKAYCQDHCGIDQIDGMTGPGFEHRLATMFASMGYTVGTTSAGNDFGADLVLTFNGVRTVVQAKRWNSLVGVSAVQEVHASRSYYGATHAMVVTNNWYTKQARQLAGKANVDLWDRDRLIQVLRETGVHLPPRPTPAKAQFSVPTTGWDRFWFLIRQGFRRYPS